MAEKSSVVGERQVVMLSTAPTARAPSVCQVTSAASLVPRSSRLRISVIANEMLPMSANNDDSDSDAVDGRSAMTTPPKPIRIASQRRQPTFSPSSRCDSAAT